MQSLIFDFDGTIINTNDLIINTLKKVAKDQLNIALDQKKITEMFGLTIDEQMKILDPDKYKTLVDYYFELYLKSIASETDLFDGIKSLLLELKNKGHQLYILTNNNTKDTKASLKRLDISTYFDDLITMDDVAVGKPDTEGLEILFKKNNLSKKNALLIGDSPHDIEAGKRFNIKTVLVGWSMFDQDDFEVQPDYIINEPKDLLELI